MIALYFGPWEQAGHHVFHPSGLYSRHSRHGLTEEDVRRAVEILGAERSERR